MAYLLFLRWTLLIWHPSWSDWRGCCWAAALSTAAMTRAHSHFSADNMARNMDAFFTDVMAPAETIPAKRELGMMPETAVVYAQPSTGYQRLPAGLRGWNRNRICASVGLSYWLLNR